MWSWLTFIAGFFSELRNVCNVYQGSEGPPSAEAQTSLGDSLLAIVALISWPVPASAPVIP